MEENMELEAMASNSNSSSSTSTGGGDESSPPAAVVVKGKRTKRPRAPAAPATSSTSSADLSGTTEEEEDMAHCLILLAQGAHRALPASAAPPTAEKFVSRRFAEAATSAGGAKAGFYVYECKTCSKCFPSFQALGGHRASHKKPKLQPAPPLPLPPPPPAAPAAASPDDYHRKPPSLLDEASLEITMNSFSAKQAVSAGKASRVHECSICGSEFSSGQALGGHMRRHRPAVAPDSPDVKKEQRNVLSLDLNLPAPSDEDRAADLATAFSFGGGRPMVFPATAAALVDCHY